MTWSMSTRFERGVITSRVGCSWSDSSRRSSIIGSFFARICVAICSSTRLPDPTDVLAQSYIWNHGHIYSRYAPGFPLILALWTGLFGEQAAHALTEKLCETALREGKTLADVLRADAAGKSMTAKDLDALFDPER